MNEAYLFPEKMEIKDINALVHRDNKTNREINADIIEVKDSFNEAQIQELRDASKAGRLRCPCDWCLAQVYLSKRDGKLYLAHKPRTAAVCPHYTAQATELVGSIMRLFDDLKTARAQAKEAKIEAKAAKTEAEAAKAEAGAAKAERDEFRKQLEKLQTFAPVLLLPLTQEMLDHREEVHEPWRVLFVIPEADLESLAPRLDLSVRPRMPGPMIPPASLEGERVH